MQRNGLVRVFSLRSREHRLVQALAQRHMRPGSLHYTDDWQGHASLAVPSNHMIVWKDAGRPMAGIT